MLTLDEALSIANETLQEWNDVPEQSPMMFTKASFEERGWVFYYQSVQWAETRNWLHSLGGNSPILVKPDGSVEILTIVKEMGWVSSDDQDDQGIEQ